MSENIDYDVPPEPTRAAKPPVPRRVASAPAPVEADTPIQEALQKEQQAQLAVARTRISALESDLKASREESTRLSTRLSLFSAGCNPDWSEQRLSSALRLGDPSDGPFGAVLVLLERAHRDLVDQAELGAGGLPDAQVSALMLAAQSVARVQQSIRERYNQSRKEWGLDD
jgi:uncharacterized protein with von Willebrand factor type A (vWA) domain